MHLKVQKVSRKIWFVTRPTMDFPQLNMELKKFEAQLLWKKNEHTICEKYLHFLEVALKGHGLPVPFSFHVPYKPTSYNG
jgi:hypothetical protein